MRLGKSLILTIILFISLFGSNVAVGQNKFDNYNFERGKNYIIKMRDGSEFIGNFLYKDSISIVIKTGLIPKIDIPLDKIKSIEVVGSSNIKHGVYWFPNVSARHYIFGPSAFNLKKGEGYYQNTYLFLNSFNIGITNNVSIGGGIEFLSTFVSLAAGDFQPIYFVTSKIGFKVTDKFHMAGGIMTMHIPGFGLEGGYTAGLLNGIGTYGNADHNLTGGLSWGYINGDFSARPFITLSGMTRISRRTAIVSENWLIPGSGFYGVYSYGIRFLGEKLSVDLVLLNNRDIARGLIIGIPVVHFTVMF
jgi:hypothetical protein